MILQNNLSFLQNTFFVYKMRASVFLFLFLMAFFKSFGQPISIQIDSIISKDSLNYEREFKLTYSVINNTSDTLKLFFNPNGLIPSTGGSMSKNPYYKIYENGNFIQIGGIFTTKNKEISRFLGNNSDVKTQEDFEKKYIEFISYYYKTPLDSLLKIYSEKGFDNVLNFQKDKASVILKKERNNYQILRPNEKMECFAILYWDKKRYFYIEPNEYYLDENEKHYFEITLVALKEDFKGKIDDTLYDKIIKDPHFIKGVFISNKVEINLRPN